MTSAPGTLMLLDTASLYYRAFFGIPDSITAPDGRPANAVRGLLDFMSRLTSTYAPTHLVACWDDDWRPQFRVDAIPTYKAHRVADESTDEEETPDTLLPQIDAIAEVLDAFGIARVGFPDAEADDVIGTLTTRWRGPVDIVTGDRDLFQLVDDSRPVRVLYTARGVSKHDIVDESYIFTKYGIPGTAYGAFASLRGDPSDGLPGVKGVGEKTAATLVNQYKSIEAIVEAVDNGDADLPARPKLEAARAYLAVAPMVVNVKCDLAIPTVDGSLANRREDKAALDAISTDWGLASPLTRLTKAIAEVTASH